jgi:hypothetical protein
MVCRTVAGTLIFIPVLMSDALGRVAARLRSLLERSTGT